MNAPAHVLIGAALFGRDKTKRVVLVAMIGALLPDLSLYLMAGTALFIPSISPGVVFDELYFCASCQTVFAIGNSFIIWGVLLGVALWMRKDWFTAMTATCFWTFRCIMMMAVRISGRYPVRYMKALSVFGTGRTVLKFRH
ncbi:MAG: hypothetical protein WBV71_14660 [Roseobacter sp.]